MTQTTYELDFELTGDEAQALSFALDAQDDLLEHAANPEAAQELANLRSAATKFDAACQNGKGGYPFTPTIAFSDDAIASTLLVLHSLRDFTVDLEIPDNTGYPCERVSIVRIDDDGDVVVCETEDDGAPIINATWAVPVNLIKKVTVI